MTDTIITHGWADIDQMNQQHYRKHPVAIRYAGIALACANEFHLDMIDRWEDGWATADDIHEALAAYLLVSKYYARIWDNYMADGLTEQRYDLLRDELADRDDDHRSDLQAVQ